ncbi:hypothetical protein PIB30_037832 [Stylosanthes scabra]|uniref:Uncharacterized protein n=1 Tax=Stylosanthes scabra TaxID=79078 RepID=A0ABU6SF41_9FABA|nr:hypothetical protein [Stylosanthes scabra]
MSAPRVSDTSAGLWTRVSIGLAAERHVSRQSNGNQSERNRVGHAGWRNGADMRIWSGFLVRDKRVACGSKPVRVKAADRLNHEGCEAGREAGSLMKPVPMGFNRWSSERKWPERARGTKRSQQNLEGHCCSLCVRIQAWAAHPNADLGTYAYAYEASMRTYRSILASINRGAFHHFKGIPLPHLA